MASRSDGSPDIKPSIHAVATDDSVNETLARALAPLGWTTVCVAAARDSFESAGPRPDCIVVDLDRRQGMNLARSLLFQRDFDVPCVGLTRDPDVLRVMHAPLFERWTVLAKSRMGNLTDHVVAALLSWVGRPSHRLFMEVREMPPVMDPDFRAHFADQPTSDLVLTPDLQIAAMSGRYAVSTMLDPANHVGRPLFEVFPDNPEDPAANGVENLNQSLRRALRHGLPDQMELQRYDVRQGGTGPFEERWWYPINYPVMRGSVVRFVVHRVEDVTRFVSLQRAIASAPAVRGAGAGADRPWHFGVTADPALRT